MALVFAPVVVIYGIMTQFDPKSNWLKSLWGMNVDRRGRGFLSVVVDREIQLVY